MEILINTDSNIIGNDRVARRIRDDVRSELSRFSTRLTRVEIHLRDEMAGRTDGCDIRCLVEARPGRGPAVAVTHDAATPEQACSAAVRKLASLLETRFGRLRDRRRSESIRHMEVREGLL